MIKKIILLLLTVLISNTISAQLNNGLIAKYYFNNGTANDDWGSVHGTTNNASLTTDRFGCSNQAYHFNPADTSFIGLGDNFDGAIVGSTAQFSFSIWFRRTDLTQQNECLLAKYAGSPCGESEREFFLTIGYDDKLNFLYYNSLGIGAYRGIASSTTILDTTWHHVVINYNANTNGNNGLDRITFYLDGVQETTTLVSSAGSLGSIQNGTAHFTIGAASSSNGTYCGPDPNTNTAFAGDLDDIRIYNRLLSISDIALLYNEVYNCFTGTNPIAQYYFNNSNTNDDLGTFHGTGHNSTLTFDRFGCPNKAYHFNPADTSFISLGDNFDGIMTGSTAQFSFSIWFRRTDLAQQHECLLGKYGHVHCGEDEREFFLTIGYDDKLNFLYYSSLGFSDYRGIAGSTLILDTAWHHAVITYNANTNANNGQDRVTLYIDGVQETTTLANSSGSLGSIQNGTAHFTIGAASSSTGNYCGPDPNTHTAFAGDLDDIRIYNKVLNTSEVLTLFNEPDSCSILGIPSVASTPKEIFKLYPNPTNANLTIELLDNIAEQSFIEIFNLQGQLVQRIGNIAGQNSQTIDVAALPSGLYYVALKDKKGMALQSLRFVKN